MEYENIRRSLKEAGQEQLLKFYDDLNEEQRRRLLSQIDSIDLKLPELIKNRERSAGKGVISPLKDTVSLGDRQKRRKDYEDLGIKAIRGGKVAALLLAGGQGTRLGSDSPKGMYNIGVTKDVYIFEMLIRNLLDTVEKAGAFIPLYIMTSEKNRDDTVSFLEEKNYFGYPSEYVRFFVQAMAPSCDYNGKIYLEDKGLVSTSPNGNGGWFVSFMNSDCGQDAKDRGIEWINVFAVDNVCQRIADPEFVGAAVSSGLPCASKVVAKVSPEEKVGVLCLEDGRPSIVEYYELPDEMRRETDSAGSLVYKYGVILNYLFRMDKLIEIMNDRLSVHIVEKQIPYIDENGNKVSPEKPNGFKFETLVLDMIHMMDGCLAYEVDRDYEFAPIKNKTGADSVESARALLIKNGVEL